LSGVHFIDGAGLTALVGTVRRAREQLTRVAVVVPPGSVRKVLGEARLDQIGSVWETAELALAEIYDNASTPESSLTVGHASG
jgi:anti-anti-sigma regulatory factor